MGDVVRSSTRRIHRMLAVEELEARVAPATFTVVNANDSGAGSLRQAILDANAAGGADDIAFSGVSAPRSPTPSRTTNSAVPVGSMCSSLV